MQNLNTLPSSAQQQLEALIQRSLGDIFPACALAVIKHGKCVLNTG